MSNQQATTVNLICQRKRAALKSGKSVLPSAVGVVVVVGAASKRKLSDLSLQMNADNENNSQRERFNYTGLCSLAEKRQLGKSVPLKSDIIISGDSTQIKTRASNMNNRQKVSSSGKCARKLRRFMVATAAKRKTSTCSSSSSISVTSNGFNRRLIKQEPAGCERLSAKQASQRYRYAINWLRQAQCALNWRTNQELQLACQCNPASLASIKRAQMKPSMSVDEDDYEDVEVYDKSDSDDDRIQRANSHDEDDDGLLYYANNGYHHHDKLNTECFGNVRSDNYHYDYHSNHRQQKQKSSHQLVGKLDEDRVRALRKFATVLRPQLSPAVEESFRYEFVFERMVECIKLGHLAAFLASAQITTFLTRAGTFHCCQSVFLSSSFNQSCSPSITRHDTNNLVFAHLHHLQHDTVQ